MAVEAVEEDPGSLHWTRLALGLVVQEPGLQTCLLLQLAEAL